MESATRQSGLQQLNQQLQERLNSLFHSTPTQVQCVVKQGSLMVLIQHPPDEDLDPEQVFRVLQQDFQAMSAETLTEFGVPVSHQRENQREVDATESASFQIKLYLRALGQKQPYALHAFRWSPLQESEKLFDQTSEEVAPPPEKPDEQTDALTSEPTSEADAPPIDYYLSTEASSTEDPSLLSLEERLRLPDPDLEESSALTYPAIEPEEPAPTLPSRRFRSKSLLWLILGMAAGTGVLVAGVLALTRPCVIGPCEPLQTAQALTQQATQTLQTATSEQELKQAQQQLVEVDRLLEQIPAWSLHRGEVEALQQSYRSQADTLNQLLTADSRAAEALQKSQTLPQTVEDWQGIQSALQAAISQLQAVPQPSPLYSFAQQRLATYQQNLATVNQNIAIERLAQKKVKAAKDTAKIAEARQSAAQSMETWQQARITWQVVVNALRQIPNTTSSHVEAQQLLATYEQRLADAGSRVTQEQFSKRAYTQAINFAQRAESLQKQNQWTQAVSAWRDAVSYAKQVPNGTLYYNEIQPRVPEYTNSLKQAETRLQGIAALQKIRADLENVCSGSPQICRYTILRDSIQLRLTAAYERAVRTAFAIGRSGDYNTLGGTVNHLDTLEAALQTISNNAGVPVVVYDANGSEVIGSFVPRV